LEAAAAGDPKAVTDLLPLAYDELCKLAAARMAPEKPGQTIQATALVHEAYLRLVGSDVANQWNGRGHFFAAAAEVMRRILVESERRKKRVKHGGEHERVDLLEHDLTTSSPPDEILAQDQALTRLTAEDPEARRWYTSISLSDCRSKRSQKHSASRGQQPIVNGPTPAPGFATQWVRRISCLAAGKSLATIQ